MKFSLSTFAALAAIMLVIASEPLKIPMVLTVVTSWQDGSVTLPGQPPFDIGIDGKGDEVSIVVGESLQKYQRIGEILFDNIDPNDKRRVQFSRLIDGQGVTRSYDVAVVDDPGVKFVHIILNGDWDANINVYDKDFSLIFNQYYSV